MEKSRQIIGPFLILILFFSCNKKTIKEDYNNEIYSQILQEVIDSCATILPPQPNKNQGKEVFEKYRQRVKEIHNEKKIIAIFDTIYGNNKDRFEKIVRENNLNAKWNISDSVNSMVDVENYKINSNIKLVEATDLPSLYKFSPDNKSWENYNDLKDLYVAIELRRIIINENKLDGFLQIGIICGNLCGQGFDLWIKKENKKWKIVKRKATWIS